MASCKAKGLKNKTSGIYAERKKKRNEEASRKEQRKKIKNPNKTNKHRIYPVVFAKGFHRNSLQLKGNFKGDGKDKRYEIDKNGTLRNME